MCSFEKSPQAKSCVKTNCTQTPQYRHMTVRHENKAAYQTPKNYQLPNTNDEKKRKMPDGNKTIFSHFWGKRARPSVSPEKDSTPFIPEPPPPHWGTNLGSNCVETLIFTTRPTAELYIYSFIEAIGLTDRSPVQCTANKDK